MTGQPMVTALVPCHNAAGFLDETLAALAAQSWGHLEILIGDDASTDATPAIIAAFAARHPQVRVITQARNLGWRRHLNLLMDQARGEYLFFAFHDDLIAPDYVARLAGALIAAPGAVLAFGDMRVTELSGAVTEERFCDLEGLDTSAARGRVMLRFPHGWWVPNRGLFRASAFRRLGGIPGHAAGDFSADWLWLLQLALDGPLVRVPGQICRKIYRPGSVTKTTAFTRARVDALRAGAFPVIWRSRLGPLAKAAMVAELATRDERAALAHFARVLGRLLGLRRPG